ncbi:hypothetical protein D3C80_2205800 [compost metagenome]
MFLAFCSSALWTGSALSLSSSARRAFSTVSWVTPGLTVAPTRNSDGSRWTPV